MLRPEHPRRRSVTKGLSLPRVIKDPSQYDLPKRREIPTLAIEDYKINHVISTAKPFAKTTFRESKGAICDYCLKSSRLDTLKRCKACEKFFYCSRECQLADWNEAHKFKECSMYKKDTKNTLNQCTATLRLVARIYLMLRHSTNLDKPSPPKKKQSSPKSGESSSLLISQQTTNVKSTDEPSSPKSPKSLTRPTKDYQFKDYQCFNGHNRNYSELISHADKYKYNAKISKFCQYKDVFRLVLMPNYDWNSDDLLDIYTKIIINSIEIATQTFCNETGKSKREEPMALGLYIPMTIFDHSCDANCMFVFNGGDELQLTAKRAISKDETLYVQYLETRPTVSSHTALRLYYYFTCDCAICRKLPDVTKTNIEYQVLRQEFYSQSCRGNNVHSLLLLHKMNTFRKKHREQQEYMKFMDIDLENVSAIFTRAQLADGINYDNLCFQSYDEIIRAANKCKTLRLTRALLTSIDLVGYLKNLNRYCLAQMTYKKGETIRDKIPNYYILLPEHKNKYCDLCLKKFEKKKTRFYCLFCCKFHYCSKECQTTDSIVHKSFECALYRKDRENFLTLEENAKLAYIIRMYVCVRNEIPIDFRFRDERFFVEHSDEIDGLTINKQPKSVKNYTTYKVFCENYNIYPKSYGHPVYDILDCIEALWPEYLVDDDSLIDLFSFAHTNMIDIYTGDMRLAIGSFSTYRVTERSLEPNSEMILSYGKLSLVATRDISKGDKITIGFR